MSGSRTDGRTKVRRSGAETARKVIELLFSFSPRRPTATVREMAADAGLPLPTAHRYVALLKELGLLEETGRSHYQLGWRVLQLAQAARVTQGLFQVAEPVMRRLCEDTDETVTLFQLDGDEIVVVGQVESTRLMKISCEPGVRWNLYHGASARAILASLADAQRMALVDDLARRRPDLLPDPAALHDALDEVRRVGYAESFEEIDPGVWAVSSPIDDGCGTVATLSLAGPIARTNDDDRRRITGLVREAAREVSDNLRRRSSSP